MNQTRAFNLSLDLISAGAIVGAFMGALPALAGLAGLIWYAIQIYESKTVQKHVRRHRMKKRWARLVKRQAVAVTVVSAAKTELTAANKAVANATPKPST